MHSGSYLPMKLAVWAKLTNEISSSLCAFKFTIPSLCTAFFTLSSPIDVTGLLQPILSPPCRCWGCCWFFRVYVHPWTNVWRFIYSDELCGMRREEDPAFIFAAFTRKGSTPYSIVLIKSRLNVILFEFYVLLLLSWWVSRAICEQKILFFLLELLYFSLIILL